MDVQKVRCQIVSLALLLMVYLTHCATTMICRDSIDILSNQGVRIEPYHKSHVKLALVDQLNTGENSEFRLSFDFRTTSPDGILFYGRSNIPEKFIGLILKGGYLIYKIVCDTFHMEILLGTQNDSRLNDGSWHKIALSIKDNIKGHIEIDGFSTKLYTVRCGPLTTLIMGGSCEDDKGHISSLEYPPGHFEGCIRNVYVPVPLRYPPKYYAVSACD